MTKPTLIWHRLDLRLEDNPALDAAVRRGGPIVPIYIWAPEEEATWEPGGASRWWLHQSLRQLAESYRSIGSRLIIRQGSSLESLRALVRETGATAIFWSRRYEPKVMARDAKIESYLRDAGMEVETFNSALLHEPWTVKNKAGRPFQVFTPFWKHCLAASTPTESLARPTRLVPLKQWPLSLSLSALELEPKTNWTQGMRDAWEPGEAGAKDNLNRFLKGAYKDYNTARNRPDLPGTSRLSPHLHFGEISPRQICAAVDRLGIKRVSWNASQYLSELGWREFAHHLLYHFPKTPEEPLRAEFAHFRWRRKQQGWLRAWQKGETGYPIVDAGMRELWATGWMHNRVRMIVASFLVKDLLISWTEGARWFWDTLVDADLAQNTLGWQWTAGCGADAAPFFRIFNPVLQGEKFDPNGAYVARWCPELKRLPHRWIHQPWKAPEAVLSLAGVQIGKTYPELLVSHAIAREVALEEYGNLKRRGQTG